MPLAISIKGTIVVCICVIETLFLLCHQHLLLGNLSATQKHQSDKKTTRTISQL